MPCGPFILGIFPLVKGLIHHQKAHSVTQLIQLRHMRIMTAPNSIAATLLQSLQTSLPYLRFHRRTQGSAIMMNADSLQLCLHTIQKKTSPRIKAYIANPRYGFVHHIEAFVGSCLPASLKPPTLRICALKIFGFRVLGRRICTLAFFSFWFSCVRAAYCIPGAQGVQVWMLRRPEPGLLQASLHHTAFSDPRIPLHAQDSLPLFIFQHGTDFYFLSCQTFIW